MDNDIFYMRNLVRRKQRNGSTVALTDYYKHTSPTNANVYQAVTVIYGVKNRCGYHPRYPHTYNDFIYQGKSKKE